MSLARRRSRAALFVTVCGGLCMGVACANIAGLEHHKLGASAGEGGARAANGGTESEAGGGTAGVTATGNGGAGASTLTAGASGNVGFGGDGGDPGRGGTSSISAGNGGSPTVSDAPPSCAPGERGAPSAPGTGHDCGLFRDQDCCASPVIDAGSVKCVENPQLARTVESFRLDKFEVTVGRFRVFSDAVLKGWRPAPRSGQHPSGANHTPADAGWNSTWNVKLPSGRQGDGWNEQFIPCGTNPFEEPADPEREWLPMSCVTYFSALAFCIWDGGYLPSALEETYAAAGGDHNWMYPWGDMPIDVEHAIYRDALFETPQPVGSVPLGDGFWGQSDMVGNVWEWCSFNGGPAAECAACNCDHFDSTFNNGKEFGGSYGATAMQSTANSVKLLLLEPGLDQRDVGIRCARAP